MGSEINIQKPDYRAQTLDRMNRLRHENVHCDFIIKVDRVEIPVHKVVVCANSDYFNAMLSHQETLESKTGTVEMKETDAESVKICIDFIYTGQARFSYKNAAGVLYNAKMFQLKELCEEIIDILSENLSVETFFHTKKLAVTYSCDDLIKKCDRFAFQHFEEIAKQDAFVNLSESYIIPLMKSPKLIVDERVKLGSLIKWIKHDPDNRKEDFKVILKSIKLGEVPTSYRRYLVENENLVKNSLECMRLFTESFFADVKPKDYKASGSKQSDLQGIGVVDWDRSSINVFNPATKNWIDKPAMGLPQGGHGTVLSLNDDIYVLSSDQSVYKLCYTRKNATWQPMQSMQYEHGNPPPAVVFDGLIYAVGNGQAESYDPASNKWSTLPRCDNLVGSSVTATSNAVYTIGGIQQNGQSSTQVQKYNPNGQPQWCNVSQLKSAQVDGPAVGLNNKIYVLITTDDLQPRRFFGASIAQQSIRQFSCYDETDNIWTIVRGMQLSYTLDSACAINGDIYACRGRLESQYTFRAARPKYHLLRLNFENEMVEEVCELENVSASVIFAINMVL